MSKTKKAIALFLAILTLVPCFLFPASAKNVCQNVGGSSDADGAVNTIFYATTTNTKKHTIKMTMTKGKFVRDDYVLSFSGKDIYDYYEILIYGKNSSGKYVQIDKINVKNKSSYNIPLKGYTDYKIKVYSWKTSTINSYEGFFKEWKQPLTNVIWEKIPTWSISKTKGVTYCT